MLRGKNSLFWCSLYSIIHHLSIQMAHPSLIIFMKIIKQREFRLFLHFLFSFITPASFFFFFCFCSRPWTVLAVLLQNDKYLKLALCISLCYKQRSSLWLCKPVLATEQAQPFVQFKDVNRIFIPHIFYVDGVWTNQIFILSVLYETKLVFRHINF